jgi:hypothetical protein
VQYGPFPTPDQDGPLKESVIQNIGGGGLMFVGSESIPSGEQLVMKIIIPGWQIKGDDIIETSDPSNEAVITAVAEVLRSEETDTNGVFEIGVRFLGRILD